MTKRSIALFTMVFWVVIGAILKKFSNFLRYLILIEGVCVSLGGILICCQGMDRSHRLFVFLVLVACETSLGLSLIVGILRNSDSGVYSLYSQSALDHKLRIKLSNFKFETTHNWVGLR